MRRVLMDGEMAFEVTLLGAAAVERVVLFAVGGGGDPGRHGALLEGLAARGWGVVAPHFERLLGPEPTEEALLLRARGLRVALDSVAGPGVRVVGVGHSIGATMLLALAGGRVWMREGRCLSIEPEERIQELALMAPATGFFQAPGALERVRGPVLVWAGTEDRITPVAQAEFLVRALEGRGGAELRVVEGAGHFSFMNVPPPQVVEPLADREGFLARLAGGVGDFLEG